jgi:CheY-like chemotaxis protein
MARLLIVEDNRELADLIATMARGRGHEAHVAHGGKPALEAAEGIRFDAAVVDLLLPDLRGSEVLGALSARTIPAVAISGVYKGDAFALEATRVHGAAAFLEKPFDMNKLLEAVERAARLTPAPPPEPAADDLDELAPLADGARPESAWPQKPKPKAAAAEWARSGSLEKSPVPRLLNAYYEARHRGELKLKQGPVLKVVYFEEGRPVYAASNLARERFARFCARKGVIPGDDLAAVADLAKEEGVRTGEAMVQLGLISAERRLSLLEEQVREIIWSTFRWNEGEYSFAPKRPNRVDLVRLSVFPGDLILQGVEREYPLVELRQKLPASQRLFPSPDPPYQLHELKLNDPQARLIAYADGSKAVEDLLALSDLSEQHALATLFAFQSMGLLEARGGERGQRIIYSF